MPRLPVLLLLLLVFLVALPSSLANDGWSLQTYFPPSAANCDGVWGYFAAYPLGCTNSMTFCRVPFFLTDSRSALFLFLPQLLSI